MRAERNSALLALASELPGPVLAEAVGMHIATAVRWSSLAARDWSCFLAARDQGAVLSSSWGFRNRQ